MDRDLNALLAVDPAVLSHDQLLDHLAAIERGKAALDAAAQPTLHLLAVEDCYDGIRRELEREWVREEVACVLRLAPVTAHSRLADASTLVTRLPDTLALVADGSISMLHARALTDAVADFDSDTTQRIEARVLAKAGTQTVGEFRQAVKKAVIAADPRQAEQKHRHAVAERQVRMWAEDDGMASVKLYTSADEAQRLWTAVDAHACALKDSDDVRTADQKRADVLADLAALALHNAPVKWQGRKPAVQVAVALSTLLGLDEQPGDLAGYGPIPAGMARRMAADSSGTWTRLITDPRGRLLDYEQTTYRAPAPLREHVLAEARTCTFPGCRRPPRKNDLDHILEWDYGGHTSAKNQHPPCERHHLIRHDGRWTIRRHDDGTITWTTPTGRAFDRPPYQHPVDTTSATQPDKDADPEPPPF